jgi:outer membrane translocation and assembly module TamA
MTGAPRRQEPCAEPPAIAPACPLPRAIHPDSVLARGRRNELDGGNPWWERNGHVVARDDLGRGRPRKRATTRDETATRQQRRDDENGAPGRLFSFARTPAVVWASDPDMVRAMPLVGGSRSHPVVLAAVALIALAGSGCYRVPPGKSAVSDVAIAGTHDIDEDELSDRIATRESSRFLGIFEGVVFEYELFDQYALRRDLQRVERYLRARGYYEAHVRAARVVEAGNKVRVTIEVDQGEPVVVDAIGFIEKTPIDEKTRTAIRRQVAAVLPIGNRFDEDKFEESEKAALKGLTSTGHAAATVKRRSEVDLGTHRARLYYEVEPGPLGKFGPVRFEGLGELPESSVRRVFGIEEGTRYSSEEVEEARQALLDLGVLASVEVEQNLADFQTTKSVPITVKAQPAKLRAFLVGAGVELDSLKTDVHTQIGWQNSNFLGGLRKLDLRYKPGLVLYPTRFPDLLPPTDPLYEHKINASLRQPAFVEKRTIGFTRAEYSIYPVLLPTATENVLGYHELRGEVGVERTFLRRIFVSPEYDFQANFPFDYVGRVQQVETLFISYFGLVTNLDYRDNPIKPTRGVWLGNELQLAGGALQGDANDIRVRPEVRAFIPLPKRITLALRGSVGFLFPFNYARLSQQNFETPGTSRAEGSARDYQLLFFRGFFGGGPSSNRGYPLRGVGPHDFIPYLSPAGQSLSAGGCNPNDVECSLPTGGLSLWEANAELRFVISGPFATAVFCDAGDVSPFSVSIRPERPHLSCGAGARYDTPVGPIRLDVGYRIPGLQYPKDASFEREPDLLFGAPIVIAFGIGEAF